MVAPRALSERAIAALRTIQANFHKLAPKSALRPVNIGGKEVGRHLYTISIGPTTFTSPMVSPEDALLVEKGSSNHGTVWNPMDLEALDEWPLIGVAIVTQLEETAKLLSQS